MSRRTAVLPLALLVALSTACDHDAAQPPPASPPSPALAPSSVASPPGTVAPAKISRADFNRYAVRLNLPLFWAADPDGDGIPDRDEVKTLLFFPTSDSVDFERARASILSFDPAALPAGLLADEVTRRKLVADDLDQGSPSVIYTDLRASSPADKALLPHVLAAAKLIDDVYATVRGAKALAGRVPTDDVASQSLFRRDWGPACAGAKTAEGPGVLGNRRPAGRDPRDERQLPGRAPARQGLLRRAREAARRQGSDG